MAWNKNGAAQKVITRNPNAPRDARPINVLLVGPTAPNVDGAGHWTVALYLGYPGKSDTSGTPKYHAAIPESALPMLHARLGEYIAAQGLKAHPESVAYATVREYGRKCPAGHTVSGGQPFCGQCGARVGDAPGGAASETAETAESLQLS